MKPINIYFLKMNYTFAVSTSLFLVYCCLCVLTSSVVSPKVIHDFEIFAENKGVPIDFSYNETTTMGGPRHISAPGCPQSVEGYPWVYNKEVTACYLTGFQGPCSPSEILMPQRNTSIGVCLCDCLLRRENMNIMVNAKGRYVFCPDPTFENTKWEGVIGQIFDRSQKECYSTYEKDSGQCKENHVIANWTTDSLTCLPVCDYQKVDWRELEEKGECGSLPVTTESFSRTILGNKNCGDGEKYSDLLRKCVADHPVNMFWDE